MISFKRCPRCRGDVKKSRDAHGEYASCFQCGWYGELSRDPLSEMALDQLRKSVKATLTKVS